MRVRSELSETWAGGDAVPIHVRQVGFLAPAEVVQDYFMVPACPLEIGDRRFGGTIGHIFQEGAEGYVEGEIQGIIIANCPVGNHHWEDAIRLADNFKMIINIQIGSLRCR